MTFGAQVDRAATFDIWWTGQRHIKVNLQLFIVFSRVVVVQFFHYMALNQPVVMLEAFSGEATDEQDWLSYGLFRVMPFPQSVAGR